MAIQEEVIGLDPNLTSPIILNISMNAPTSKPIDQWWTSLVDLKNWVPLMAVLLGAYVAYVSASRQEIKKIRLEIKKEVFFDAMDSIIDINLCNIKNKMFEKELAELEENDNINPETKKKEIESKNKEIDKFDKKYKKTNLKLSRMMTRIHVVGGPSVYLACNKLVIYIESYYHPERVKKDVLVALDFKKTETEEEFQETVVEMRLEVENEMRKDMLGNQSPMIQEIYKKNRWLKFRK